MSGLELKPCSVCESFSDSQYEVSFGVKSAKWVCSKECARTYRLIREAEAFVMLFTMFLVVCILVGAALIIVTGNNS